MSEIKSALVCIAKDEDNYINEWIDYHLKLGFTHIFVYCNNWNWFVPSKYLYKVTKIEFNGDKMQVPAYDDFIKKYHKIYNFAVFTDVDEFIVLNKHHNINEFLENYKDFNCIRIPIKTFGNSRQDYVKDNNYSVLQRFTKCRKEYETIGKYIVNLKRCKDNFKFLDENWFGKIACILPDKTSFNSYYCMFINDNPKITYDIELNHYITKTWEEYLLRKLNRDVKKGIVNYNKDQILRAYCLINRDCWANAEYNTQALHFLYWYNQFGTNENVKTDGGIKND